MIIVDDAEATGLGLPSTYGVDDIPIVLQDRAFNEDGQMPYAPSWRDVEMGMKGDVPLTNGTVGAFFNANAGVVAVATSQRIKFDVLSDALCRWAAVLTDSIGWWASGTAVRDQPCDAGAGRTGRRFWSTCRTVRRRFCRRPR